MSKWDTLPLSEACQIKPVKNKAREKLTNLDMVSFVPMRNLGINTKSIILNENRELGTVYGSYTYFENNDVLLAKITPCFENGKLGVARDLTNGIGFGSSEFIVFRSKGLVEPDYLYYFLSQESFRDEGKQIMTGAVGHKRVPKEYIENYPIPIPTLQEQKQIVSILEKAFDSINNAIENTEKNLVNILELFDSYLNNLFLQQSNDCNKIKLGDKNIIQIVDGDRGKNYPKKSDFSANGDCLFLNTKNVRDNGFNFESLMFITKDKDNLLRKGKLKKRDVILTTRGTIGNIGIYDDSVKFNNIRINSGMLIFRPNEKIVTSEYLFEIFRSSIFKTQIKKYVTGAAQPQLPIKTLVNFIIPVPKKIEIQIELVDKLRIFDAKFRQLRLINNKKITALNELKQSLLHKAFTGELTAGTVKQ